MHWIALAIAAIANIVANACLKLAVGAVAGETVTEKLRSLATQSSLWAGLLSAAILLAAYLYAIRGLHLGIAYAVVAGSAMAGLTLAERLFFHMPVSAQAVAGIVLVALGIVLIAQGT